MANEDEPAKLLLPYLQRADELQKHEPLVAYYCRLYAMERGLKIPQNNRTKTTNALLVSLMKQLEKDKKSLTLGPDDHLHLEGFALNVFAKADKQDRGGRADLNTAKTFYAASIFFEILNQFGEVHPELEQKQRYAVWKAADIRRALKEGRKPQPGPPDGDKDLPLPSSTSTGEYDSEQTTNQDSTIRNNFRESQDSPTQPDSYDDISPQNHPIISPKPSSSNLTHSTSMDVSPSLNHPSDNYQSQNLNISPQSSDITRSHSMDMSSPHNYPTDGYQTFHQSPSPINSQHSEHPQSYHHQPQYQPEPQQHFTQQQYPPHHQDVPSHSYPNFQSYPSFTENSIPAASSHYTSYYQNLTDVDASYPNLPPSTVTNYPSPVHHDSSSVRNSSVSQDSSTNTHKYEYNSNYAPPPEKISEAHKSARFAVGALAFDDVVTAIEHLKKSLELLTNPSASN